MQDQYNSISFRYRVCGKVEAAFWGKWYITPTPSLLKFKPAILRHIFTPIFLLCHVTK